MRLVRAHAAHSLEERRALVRNLCAARSYREQTETSVNQAERGADWLVSLKAEVMGGEITLCLTRPLAEDFRDFQHLLGSKRFK